MRNCRTSFYAVFLSVVLAAAGNAQGQRPTAGQIIERIQKNVGVPWATPTVDTFKAGDPDTPVSGIAVTMMATMDVLERAAASGKNLIITHEPTFYSHLDTTDELAKENDRVYVQKQKFIADLHLVVWRFHDNWHARTPDGIQLGMKHALAWDKFQDRHDEHLFVLPEITLGDLAEYVKRKLNIVALRAVGDPEMKLKKVAMLPGAAGSAKQIEMLERNDVEALLIGETPEWETVEYVADATTEHRRKGLIIMGHIPSEQAGMEECARWLKTFIHGVPIDFVAAQEPFWLPQ